jgi:hypothetical protein
MHAYVCGTPHTSEEEGESTHTHTTTTKALFSTKKERAALRSSGQP